MSVIPDPATTDWVPLAGGGGGGLPADTVVVAATRIVANKLLSGDTQPAFRFMGDGKHEWGPGGSGALDTSLYRSAASHLKTDYNLVSGQSLKVNVSDAGGGGIFLGSAADTSLVRTAAGQLTTQTVIATARSGYNPGLRIVGASGYEHALQVFRNNTDGQPTLLVEPDGKLNWGPGTGIDTQLYRSAAATLRTPHTLYVDTNLIVGNTIWVATNMVVDNASAGNKLYLGGSLDTNLYRSAADTLKTDDDLVVGNLASPSRMRADGQIEAGTSVWAKQDSSRFYLGAAFDVSLYRSGAGILGTPGQLVVGQQITSTLSAAGASAIYAASLASDGYFAAIRRGTDVAWRFLIDQSGAHSWGPGGASGALDTFLSRFNTGQLYTQGDFVIGKSLYFGYGGGAEKIFFGSAQDTNLYREAANVLATDDSFHITTGQSLVMNNGSSGGPQIEFAYYGSTRQYRSWIATAHDGGTDAGNWIDFMVWTTSAGANALATLRALRLDGTGKLIIGNATDTNLYRNSVGDLRTGTTFTANAANTGLIALANVSGSPYIYFGSGYDTNLYRSAANTLTTDGYLDKKAIVGKRTAPSGMTCGAGFTAIVLGTTALDVGGCIVGDSYRLIAPRAGIYYVWCSGLWAAEGQGDAREIFIQQDGGGRLVDSANWRPSGAQANEAYAGSVCSLAASATFYMQAYTDTSASITLQRPQMGLYYLGHT